MTFWTKFSGRSRPSDKGGGGRGHPDPEIRGGPVSKKIFSGLGASFWSKNKGGPFPPGPSPGFATGILKTLVSLYIYHFALITA